MALGPLPPTLRPPTLPGQATSPARAEAVRAAQRAFFQTALAQTPAPAAQPAPAAASAPQVQAEPTTDRYPRPGSRLDIKV